MATASEIILATAQHFQEPREVWEKPRRAKHQLAIRRIAAAVVIREGASAEEAAKELHVKPQTIHDMARDCELLGRYLMRIIDIQKRLRANEIAA